jgi:hypothetical protein
MRYYPPTGTCNNCDGDLLANRTEAEWVKLEPPKFRFCSDKCEAAYKKQFPKRYREMSAQLKRERAEALRKDKK